MVSSFSFFIPMLERLLKRPVRLDPNIPVGLLMWQILSAFTGLLRGVFLTRRKLVLERGARITDLRRFHSDGGLVRIGQHSRLECVSEKGIRVGRNFKLGAFSRMVASGTLSDLGYGITIDDNVGISEYAYICLLYTSPSPRDQRGSRMPSSA